MKRWSLALFVGCGLMASIMQPVLADNPLGNDMSNLMENYSHYVPKGTLQMFHTESDAQVHCESDPVVWVDTEAHLSYTPDMPRYGKTAHGGYVCEHEAINAGDHVVAPATPRSKSGA